MTASTKTWVSGLLFLFAAAVVVALGYGDLAFALLYLTGVLFLAVSEIVARLDALIDKESRRG